MPGAAPFSRLALEADGFTGWVPLLRIGDHACPDEGGVYVVWRPGGSPPRFEAVNRGGWFKGRDPTVPLAALSANWADGAETLYIGKADRLRRRLRDYAAFGRGRPVGHWGGRLIWQLADADALCVAWQRTPDRSPLAAERALIGAFRAAFGQPPFANAPQALGR